MATAEDVVLAEAPVSSQGQITLKKSVPEILKVQPGDTVQFVLRAGKVYLRKKEA